MTWRSALLGLAVLAVGCGQGMSGDPLQSGTLDPAAPDDPAATASSVAVIDGGCSSEHPVSLTGKANAVCFEDSITPTVDGVGTNGFQYNFKVVNTGCQTIRQITLTTDRVADIPGDSVELLCPVAPGQCQAKVVPRDATGQIAACQFVLGAGDDFGCHVTLNRSTVRISLSGALDQGGSVAATTTVSVPNRCGRTPQAAFNVTCGNVGDPTYRFSVLNTGKATLRNLQIFANVRSPAGTVAELCPDGHGGCTRVNVPLAHLNSHPECSFVLGSGDDFACRINFSQNSIEALLRGTNNRGLEFSRTASTSCNGGPGVLGLHSPLRPSPLGRR